MDIQIKGSISTLYVDGKRVNIKVFNQFPEVTGISKHHKFIGYVIRPKQRKFLLFTDGEMVYSTPYDSRPVWCDYTNVDEFFKKTGYMSYSDHNRDYHTWAHVDKLKLPQIFL